MSQNLTITLYDRRPVTVDVEQWPTIASSKHYDGHVESLANRTWKLTVRQCQTETSPGGECRCIVYGVYTTYWPGDDDRRGGEIVDGLNDVPACVERVAGRLNCPDGLADRCIADLTPEVL